MIGGDGDESEGYKEMFVGAYRGSGNPDVPRRYARLISQKWFETSTQIPY